MLRKSGDRQTNVLSGFYIEKTAEKTAVYILFILLIINLV